MTETGQQYVIWSWEHLMWWAPGKQGYVTRLEHAGRYSWKEAAEIVVDHIPAGEEVAMTVWEAETQAGPTVFDETRMRMRFNQQLASRRVEGIDD